MQLTQQSFAFVFDRLTGIRVWPIADWQGGAFDPETGILSVESITGITGPFVADIVKGDPKQTNLDYLPGLRAYPAGPQGPPLLKPPYGRITAIDLNKGELERGQR